MNYDIRNLIDNVRELNVKKELIHFVLFMIDWKYTLVYGEQLTNVKWFKNQNSIMDFNLNNKNLNDYLKEIESKDNINIYDKNLSQIDLNKINLFINFVKSKTEKMLYTEFVNLYFSTYPLISSNKNELIDLVDLRNQYIDIVKDINNKKFNEIFGLEVESKYLSKNDLNEYLKKYNKRF